MLRPQDMQRPTLGPHRFATLHVGMVNEGSVLASPPVRFSIAAVEHHIHAGRNVGVVREEVGAPGPFAVHKRLFADNGMALEMNAHRALILQQDEFPICRLMMLDSNDSYHLVKLPYSQGRGCSPRRFSLKPEMSQISASFDGSNRILQRSDRSV